MYSDYSAGQAICDATKIRATELQTTKEPTVEFILYFELPNEIFKNSIRTQFFMITPIVF
jgi:hypothetical protein